jgi:hypothetical protein
MDEATERKQRKLNHRTGFAKSIKAPEYRGNLEIVDTMVTQCRESEAGMRVNVNARGAG